MYGESKVYAGCSLASRCGSRVNVKEHSISLVVGVLHVGDRSSPDRWKLFGVVSVQPAVFNKTCVGAVLPR